MSFSCGWRPAVTGGTGKVCQYREVVYRDVTPKMAFPLSRIGAIMPSMTLILGKAVAALAALVAAVVDDDVVVVLAW